MTQNLTTKIYNIIHSYKDPISGLSLNKNDKNIKVLSDNGKINIIIPIKEKYEKSYKKLVEDLQEKIKNLEKVVSVNISLTAERNDANTDNPQNRFSINAKNIIAIASGKGGVGKSTFAVNFAISLTKIGNKVGILDADIYGPSIPRMIGISDKPKVNNNKLIPLINFGIKCMSIGFLIEDNTPAIWRGPMVMKALEQMFNGVEWGELDYLIIDLPPGTGDAQLSLAQNSKLSGAIVVSTPQDIALIDAIKGINMFKKVKVPVLGIVENMSYFICDSCNKRHEIFSYGGAKEAAKEFDTNFLGEIPIDKNLRIQSDNGNPLCISAPNSEVSEIYLSIVKKIDASLNN